MHGADIIRNAPVAPGFLSEEGSEHNNKVLRQNREHHARQCSVEKNLKDIFLRSTHSSDPVILKLIQDELLPKRPSHPIAQDVLDLCDEPPIDSDSSSDSSESDNESIIDNVEE